MKEIILFTIYTICILFLGYSVALENRKAEVHQHQIDSLQTELLQAQNNVGRYEITLELLSQEDESAAAKFDSIYNNETE